jgi:hypothetical protein
MTPKSRSSHPWRMTYIRYAVFTGLLLCAANYGMDFLLDRLHIKASETMLNDLAIGVLGGFAVFFFLSASREKEKFTHAKQRIALIAELNANIRRAFGEFAASAMSEDRMTRLKSIDEAAERIDAILSEFNGGR